MLGRRQTSAAPRSAMVTNHATMTGPNSRPTLAVPRFWRANRSSSSTAAIGTTQGASPGAAISRPSTAASTEIAGVITPSP